MSEDVELKLLRHISKDCVQIGLEAGDRSELLAKLADAAAEGGLVTDGRSFLGRLRDREAEMSTGVGRGLAVPHAEVPGARETFLVGAILKKPVDYKALDDVPVDVVFLIGGKPGEVGLHLQLLARIARLARQPEFLARLRAQKTREGFISVVEEGERSLYA